MPSSPTPEPPPPAWVEIDLAAIRHNLRLIGERVDPAEILAVVKADAYGHGAVPVARAAIEAGAAGLAVARLAEAVELRRAGIEAAILVLGPASEEERAAYVEHRLAPTVSSAAEIPGWQSAAAGGGSRVGIHLKVDTGMTRLGVPAESLGEALAALRSSPDLELAGLMSHLAESDDLASPASGEQIRRFAAALEALSEVERRTVRCHLANSGGSLHFDPARHDLVRLGLSLYGLDPARRDDALRPAMSVRARISLLREVAPGARVGYGGSWTARRPSLLGVVRVGYADGYSWRLGNRGEALVRGRRVPLAGRVSMDLIVLDLTEVGAAVGEEVVLLGFQDGNEIGAWELADRAGTIPWEVFCRFGARLPRTYRA